MAEPETPTRLPAPATDNPGRLQQRRYEDDWAVLPTAETDGQLAPGSGPHGTISTSGRNPAMVVLAGAFALLWLVFFLPVLAVAIGGVVLLLAAILLFAVKEHHVGSSHGVGTLRPKHRRARRPASRGASPEA